ncbi:hypothetical protein TNIN_332981 [Trichonephila inaurata madagascariensis]|uniref:Uncharacterized protein n=1 Tax=Trichonephila inaurata madagascariensis TaxID=2747483 RepID=A0A8X6ML47_9ARAC|nr:hypothetical protein TNIN_332981 [Trichonephila inaurata madagascariensis]
MSGLPYIFASWNFGENQCGLTRTVILCGWDESETGVVERVKVISDCIHFSDANYQANQLVWFQQKLGICSQTYEQREAYVKDCEVYFNNSTIRSTPWADGTLGYVDLLGII